MIKNAMLLLTILLFIGCGENGLITIERDTRPAIEKYGELQVSAGKLRDISGNPVQLRGMSTHGIQYHDKFYSENAIQALAEEWEADIIRLSLYAREFGYEDHPEYYTERVDTLIEWATKYGMYVLIDWHQLSPGDPNLDKENAKVYLKHMAKTHGTKENILFDICNEPNNGGAYVDVHNDDWTQEDLGYTVTWNEHIKPYAEEIIPIIREFSENIIIVGTSNWASRPDLVIGNEIDDDNVMYSLHFYAADHSYGSSDYKAYLKKALAANLPIFITEFGTQGASGGGGNDFTATQEWLDLLEQEKISWCNWNYSPDKLSGAVFNRDKFSYTWGQKNTESVAFHADSTNLKDAGKWIMDKIKFPADDF